MKVVLGVDARGFYRGALDLLLRLRFTGLEVQVVHVVEGFSAGYGVAHAYRDAFSEEAVEESGLLDPVLLELRGVSVPAEPALLYGPTPAKLQEYAEAVDADLIAVGSERAGTWGSLFFGSVTRALAIGAPQSFLVAKGAIAKDGPVTAVVATDHSDYCDECLDKFLAQLPAGLRKVTLVTAHWTDLSMLDMALQVSHLRAEDLYDWIVERLKTRSDALAQRFRDHGVEADVRLSEEEPREAIASAMDETQADLLILGARGHGLRDRIALGSVALRQVVAEPHSVLVIRV